MARYLAFKDIKVGQQIAAMTLCNRPILEKFGLFFIYILSMVIVFFGAISFARQTKQRWLCSSLCKQPPIGLKKIIAYKDSYRSKTIFVVAGFYLFLESHFWLISVFLITHESFLKLGMTIIALSIVFLCLFLLLKNIIDQLSTKLIYRLAISLYALSWLLRGFMTNDISREWLVAMLVGIAFCTSFFRLAFNKRFYDIAKLTSKHEYLIIKSFYSQFFIFLIYVGLGFILMRSVSAPFDLNWIYFISAPLALIYLNYINQEIKHYPNTTVFSSP